MVIPSWLYYAADSISKLARSFRILAENVQIERSWSHGRSVRGAEDRQAEWGIVFQCRVFRSLVRGIVSIEPCRSAALPRRWSRDHLPLPDRGPRVCAIA